MAVKRWDAWKVETVKVMGEEQLLYHNNRYHVFARRHQPEGCPYEILHLSIRNNDRSTRRDWRDFQRIKNELAGREVEMVELYPREGHKVDISNQYHLWGFVTKEPIFFNMGFGWSEGRKVWNGKGTPPPIPNTEKAVQRPSEEESSF